MLHFSEIMAARVASQKSEGYHPVPSGERVWARPLLVDWDYHSHESRWHLAMTMMEAF